MDRGVSLTIEIDASAFERNVATLCERVAPADVWIALKSNAYAHGIRELAASAAKAGARGLAVLDIPAALDLRAHGVDVTLFAWLHGVATDFKSAVAQSIDIGVSTFAQLDAVARAGASLGTPGRVHLKFDSGLHRNGFSGSDWHAACTRAREWESQGAIVVVGVWSHLADAGTQADTAALDKFESAIQDALETGLTPSIRHIAASSAGLTTPRAYFDVVRFGIIAYGISPFDDKDGASLGFTPVMSVSAKAFDHSDSHVRVDAGWYDGVPQNPRGAWILVGNERCAVEEVHPQHTLAARPPSFSNGSRAAIIGHGGPTAEQWALWSGTIGDEIVTGMPASAHRVVNS
jgi:alanine racemase